MDHLFEVSKLQQQLDRLDEIAFDQHQAQEKAEQVYKRIRKLNIWMQTYSKSEIDAPHRIVKQWQEALQHCIDELEAE